jgi:hypothetical protein
LEARRTDLLDQGQSLLHLQHYRQQSGWLKKGGGAVFGMLLLSFKACFYRRAAIAAPAPAAQGEFDEKGRWYRY